MFDLLRIGWLLICDASGHMASALSTTAFLFLCRKELDAHQAALGSPWHGIQVRTDMSRVQKQSMEAGKLLSSFSLLRHGSQCASATWPMLKCAIWAYN